jgi:penicillin-binding protein 1A
VSPLEQAAAFATFAARGTYAEPYAIVRILDRHGKVVYEHGAPKTSQAFGGREVGVLTAALEHVVTDGTGTGASIGRPMAGKTGTTENYGDAWFIGYVPQLSTAVWVGYPDGTIPMTGVHGIAVTGGSFPARIFRSYMRDALADVPVQDLPVASPDDLPLRRSPKPVPLVAGTAPATTPSTLYPPTTRMPVITLPPPSPPTTSWPKPAPRPPAPVPTVPPTTTPSGQPAPTTTTPTTLAPATPTTTRPPAVT